MSWGAIAGAAISAGTAAYGANKQAKAAKAAAKAGTPLPYGVEGPGGSVKFDTSGRMVNMELMDSPFAPMFNSIGASSLANAATAPGQFLYGADPELAEAYRGTTGEGIVNASRDRLDLLRQIAEPEEKRAFNSLESRLFARGQTGTTGGGTQYEAFQNAANRADLERQLSAQDWAQTNALNRFNAALASVGSGQTGQANQWNIGSGAFGQLMSMFDPLFQQAQIGIGSASGTPPALALNQANTANGWMAPVDNFLQNSGLYSKMGDWITGKFGGGGGGTPIGFNTNWSNNGGGWQGFGGGATYT